jgi:hypothetical protein
MTLIFIYLLLARPSDRTICALWISKPPNEKQMIDACGVPTFTNEQLIMRAVNIYTNQVECERPATELPEIGCSLVPLDHYRLVIVWPDYQKPLCTVYVDRSRIPTKAEIDDQCGDLPDEYEIRYQTSIQQETKPAPAPVCQMPQLPSGLLAGPASLATNKNYGILGYNLRWNYGQDFDIVSWQNQWDDEIYMAGKSYNVPPALIKALFSVEAQFWPLYNGPNEIGMGQITDDGADIVMRYSPQLYSKICSLASFQCQAYALMNSDDRQRVRDMFRSKLITTGTPRMAAGQVAKQMDTWAQILAAYYCAAGETLGGWSDQSFLSRWNYTLAAYHSGFDCIHSGEICQSGMRYLEKIK